MVTVLVYQAGTTRREFPQIPDALAYRFRDVYDNLVRLTVIATIFMPLTVLRWGMNIPLPHFPGSDTAQFWWLLAIMAALSAGMLWAFRRMEWL